MFTKIILLASHLWNTASKNRGQREREAKSSEVKGRMKDVGGQTDGRESGVVVKRRPLSERGTRRGGGGGGCADWTEEEAERLWKVHPRELPDMMSAKFGNILTPSPLSAFGSDLYHKIHTTSAFP